MRQTGPFPCLPIYTLPNEQGKATERFEGGQHSQGRGTGWKGTEWVGCCGGGLGNGWCSLDLGSGDQEKGAKRCAGAESAGLGDGEHAG